MTILQLPPPPSQFIHNLITEEQFKVLHKQTLLTRTSINIPPDEKNVNWYSQSFLCKSGSIFCSAERDSSKECKKSNEWVRGRESESYLGQETGSGLLKIFIFRRLCSNWAQIQFRLNTESLQTHIRLIKTQLGLSSNWAQTQFRLNTESLQTLFKLSTDSVQTQHRLSSGSYQTQLDSAKTQFRLR